MADRCASVPTLIHDLLVQAFKTKASDEPDVEDLPPPPPAREVRRAEAVNLRPFVTDTIQLQRGLTLLKGKVSTAEVLGTDKTDLMPGKYEGGLKLWECTIDLIEAVRREMQDGHLAFRGKDVLELGCGHGLPGIVALLKGASRVHFQDFNEEVLINLTIPNVGANLAAGHERAATIKAAVETDPVQPKSPTSDPETRFFAGDWGDMASLLSLARPPQQVTVGNEVAHARQMPSSAQDKAFPPLSEASSESRTPEACGKSSTGMQQAQEEGRREENEANKGEEGGENSSPLAYHKKLSGTPSFYIRDEDSAEAEGGGYDVILMSETVYSPHSMPKLLRLIKKCLRYPYGVVYVAGKKHYFGVGGGTRQFKSLVEDDGLLHSHLLAEFVDGSSNVREIWKFFSKV